MGFVRAKPIILLALFGCLALSVPLSQSSGAQPTNLKVLVDEGHANLLTGFDGMNKTVQKLNATLQTTISLQSLTQNVRLLIIASPQANYTSTDITSLQGFLSSGGTIWIAGGGLTTATSTYINRLLAGLNSDLRLDQVYLEDPLQNKNSTQQGRFDLLLPTINHDQRSTEAIKSTQDVRTMFAYKPAPILGWNGNYAPPQTVSGFESRWLAASSPSSIPSTSNTLSPLYVPNQSGTQEIVIRESLTGGELVLFGSPIFTDLSNMSLFSSIQPTDNSVFVANLLRIYLSISEGVTVEPIIAEKTSITPLKVVLAVGHSLIHNNASLLTPFTNLLSAYGFQTDTSYVLITSAFLSGAEGLIIASPATQLSSVEVAAIKSWFSQGHRFLWIASNGDDPFGDTNSSFISNQLLQTLNSTLRFEVGTVYDGIENLQGQPYLLLSSTFNRAAGLAVNYTENVRSLYSPSATNILGWLNGNATRLEDQLAKFPNVTWLARTSNSSHIATLTPSHRLLAYNQTRSASVILAATEHVANNTNILLTGSPIFLNYQGTLRYPTLYGYPTDNGLFLRDVLKQTLQRYVNLTTLTGQASRPSDIEGSPLSIHIQYRVQLLNVQTLDVSRFDLVPNPSISLLIAGTKIPVTSLANGTYVGVATLNSTGQQTYNITATAPGYADQTSSGQVYVNPGPKRFALYVLGIPVLIFIAVTILVIARKSR